MGPPVGFGRGAHERRHASRTLAVDRWTVGSGWRAFERAAGETATRFPLLPATFGVRKRGCRCARVTGPARGRHVGPRRGGAGVVSDSTTAARVCCPKVTAAVELSAVVSDAPVQSCALI
jgi:hypothetical protein